MELINNSYDLFEELIDKVGMDSESGGPLVVKPYLVFLDNKGVKEFLDDEKKERFEDLNMYVDELFNNIGEMLDDEMPAWEEISIEDNLPEGMLNQDVDLAFFQVVSSLIAFDFGSGNYLHALEALSAASEIDERYVPSVVALLRESEFKDDMVSTILSLCGLILDIEEKDRIKNKFIDLKKRY